MIARIQRIIVDPIWIGATDTEVADWLDVPRDAVARARRKLLASREVTMAIAEARRVALATGYTGRVWGLIHEALREYGEAHRREK